jgi:outer membrane protein TolC
MTIRTCSNVQAVLLVAALSIPAISAGAEGTPRSFDSQPKGAVAPLPAASEGKLSLSLDEAITLALSRNLDLEVSRIETAEAGFRVIQASGAFDPLLTSNLQKSSSSSPAINPYSPTARDYQSWDLGLSQTFLPGTALGLTWSNGRSSATYDSLGFHYQNTSDSSDLTLNLNQPLLRGFGSRVNGLSIAMARNGQESSRQALVASVQKLLVEVESAYWNVVAARENLKVSSQSLDVAQDLLRITKIRVDVGTLAPIEIVGSESGVATREEAIIRARAALQNAEDVLKRLLNVPGERWSEPLVLTDEAKASDSPEFDESRLEGAFKTALERRPEMAQLRIDLSSKTMQAAADRSLTLPQLDLFGTYGLSGSSPELCTQKDVDAHRCTTVGDPISGASWSEAAGNIANRDYRNWTVGLKFSMPIFNRSERAKATISRLEVERGQASLASLEQQIKVDVRLAGRAVETAHKTIYAAEKARILAEKNLDAERKKYENGITTNFQILQVEEQLAQARLAEVQARVGYQQAVTEYHRAIGDLLETRNVTIRGEEDAALCGGWSCCGAGCWVDGAKGKPWLLP